MKILMVVGSFPVVSETFILYQVTGLLDLGHDVRIVSLNPPPADAPVHAAVDEYSLLDRTTYLDLPASRWCGAWTEPCALKWLVRRYGRKTLSGLRLVQTKWGLPHPLALTCTRLLCHAVEDPDVVHAHFGPAGLACLPATSALGIPLLTSFHGYDVHLYSSVAGARCYRKLFRYGSLFLANTKDTRRRLVDIGCPPDRTLVYHEGTPVREMPFAPRKARPGQPVNLLTVGRLVEFKGHPYALRAVAGLIKHGYDLKYRIVGDGPMRTQLQSLINSLGVQEHILLLGSRCRDDVLALYGQSDIFILASITTSEGRVEAQGLVVQEAQACGLPVVVTNNGGIPEGIVAGETGLLVPEGDVHALADSIQFLVDHPEMWPEMGRKGREFVEECFDMDKLNRRLVSTYEEAIRAQGKQLDEPSALRAT